jgi:transposase
MSEQQSRSEQLERKRTYWKRHIESWRRSGMSQLAFCQEHDLKAHQFTYWKKRFVQTETGITFVPVKIHHQIHTSSAAATPSLRLIVDRDLQIEIQHDFDPQLLCKVIAAIRTLP